MGSCRARDGDGAGGNPGAGGSNRIKTAINPGEGAFYGPKFEYVLRDAIGRDWQCGTTQVDFNLPERFGAFYIDADGSKKAPVMVHRAICGSMERFIGILIEHFAGNFPLWLAPVQAVVTTITSEGDEYAKVVAAAARRAGLRVEIDLRNEKINYKVREHSLAKIPALLVVGKKEAESPFGLDPPARQRRPEGDADRRGDRRAGRGSDAAGREAGALGDLGSLVLPDLDQGLGGDAESFVQSPDHIERQFAPAIEHFVHAITAADKRDEVARLQSALLHVVSDRLYRVRQVQPVMLPFPSLDQRNQYIEPIALG